MLIAISQTHFLLPNLASYNPWLNYFWNFTVVWKGSDSWFVKLDYYDSKVDIWVFLLDKRVAERGRNWNIKKLENVGKTLHLDGDISQWPIFLPEVKLLNGSQKTHNFTS